MYGSICLKCFSLPFQLSDSSDDYEFSVEFTKNSRGLGFTVSSYVGDLNSGMELTSFNWSIIDYLITNYIINCTFTQLAVCLLESVQSTVPV